MSLLRRLGCQENEEGDDVSLDTRPAEPNYEDMIKSLQGEIELLQLKIQEAKETINDFRKSGLDEYIPDQKKEIEYCKSKIKNYKATIKDYQEKAKQQKQRRG